MPLEQCDDGFCYLGVLHPNTKDIVCVSLCSFVDVLLLHLFSSLLRVACRGKKDSFFLFVHLRSIALRQILKSNVQLLQVMEKLFEVDNNASIHFVHQQCNGISRRLKRLCFGV